MTYYKVNLTLKCDLTIYVKASDESDALEQIDYMADDLGSVSALIAYPYTDNEDFEVVNAEEFNEAAQLSDYIAPVGEYDIRVQA